MINLRLTFLSLLPRPNLTGDASADTSSCSSTSRESEDLRLLPVIAVQF
jgi:hypothetical protein